MELCQELNTSSACMDEKNELIRTCQLEQERLRAEAQAHSQQLEEANNDKKDLQAQVTAVGEQLRASQHDVEELQAELAEIRKLLDSKARENLSDDDNHLWDQVRDLEDTHHRRLKFAYEEYSASLETGAPTPKALSQRVEKEHYYYKGQGFYQPLQEARRELKRNLLDPTATFGVFLARREELAKEHCAAILGLAPREEIDKLPLASWITTLLNTHGTPSGSQPTTRPNYTKILQSAGILILPDAYHCGRKAGNLAREVDIPWNEVQPHEWVPWWCELGSFQDPNSMDDLGWLPLHHALDSMTFSERAFYAAERLIEQTDNINAATLAPSQQDKGYPSGYTPLHFACDGSDKGYFKARIVGQLLDYGADPNAKDAKDNTPLHKACGSGLSDVAELLCARGADATALNKDGKGVWQAAACSPSLQYWLTANTSAPKTFANSSKTRVGESQSRMIRHATSTRAGAADTGKGKDAAENEKGKGHEKGKGGKGRGKGKGTGKGKGGWK